MTTTSSKPALSLCLEIARYASTFRIQPESSVISVASCGLNYFERTPRQSLSTINEVAGIPLFEGVTE